MIMRWFGSYTQYRYPRVSFFQYSVGISVFGLLALRRLSVDPPYDGLQVISALVRAGAFGMIAFGITGGIATVFLMGSDGLQAIRSQYRARKNLRETQLQNHRETQERLRRLSIRPNDLKRQRERTEKAEIERKKRESEDERRRKAERDRNERKTLRLQTMLKMQAIPDVNRRQSVRETMDVYLDEESTIDEFTKRFQLLQEHIGRESSIVKPGFQTLTEIENSFAEQFDEIDSLAVHEVEKASLRSYLTKEKQATIHNFLKKGT
jgi:hypothetical protein